MIVRRHPAIHVRISPRSIRSPVTVLYERLGPNPIRKVPELRLVPTGKAVVKQWRNRLNQRETWPFTLVNSDDTGWISMKHNCSHWWNSDETGWISVKQNESEGWNSDETRWIRMNQQRNNLFHGQKTPWNTLNQDESVCFVIMEHLESGWIAMKQCVSWSWHTLNQDETVCFTVMVLWQWYTFNLFHAVSRCFIALFHDVSCCFKVFHCSVSWCFKLLQDVHCPVSSCFMTMKQMQLEREDEEWSPTKTLPGLPPHRNMTYPLSPAIVHICHSAGRDDSPPALSRYAIRSVEVNSMDPTVHS